MKRCHFIRRLLPLTCLVILSGCAAPQHIAPAYSEEELSQERQTQYQLAFEYQLQQQIRLAEVSRPCCAARLTSAEVSATASGFCYTALMITLKLNVKW